MKLNKQFLLYGTSDFDIDIQIAKRTFVAKKNGILKNYIPCCIPMGIEGPISRHLDRKASASILLIRALL